MRQFGLLGEKLGHSLSPEIHSLLYAKLGMAARYDLLEVPASKLGALFTCLPQNYGGINVTIPYKVAIMPELTRLSAEAEAIGAVNTIVFKGRELIGYNTDYTGFGRLLEHNGISVKKKQVAVLGTGGAARAVWQYLADAGAAEIAVVSRNAQKARQKLVSIEALAGADFLTYAELRDKQGDLLINTTPVGMFPAIDASPVGAAVVRHFTTVVDLIYNPQQTLLLQYAEEAGVQAVNGLYMLVAQALASEEIWLNRKFSPELAEAIAGELTHK